MDTQTAQPFRRVKALLAGYLGVSLAALAVIVALRNNASEVNTAVWIRATAVAVSALVMTILARRAGRGSRSAYRRLRILSIAMLVAIAVIIALPGTFPVWLKAEQAVCGVLLIGVMTVINTRHLRVRFR